MTVDDGYVETATAAPAIGIDLREERLRGTLFRLSIPLVAERLSMTTINIVDAVLVGRFVGSDGVAAVGIAGLLFWLPMSGAWAVTVGATAVVARDTGARAFDELQRSVRASIAFAVIWGVAVVAFLMPMAHLLMQLMAARPGVLSAGVDYILVGSLGMPFSIVMSAASGCLRGVGNTRTPMIILVISNTVNALVAFLLISGFLGLPQLGVVAAGAGFASAGFVGGVLALAVLIRGYGPLRFQPLQAHRFGGRAIKRLLNIGIPVGLEELQFMLAFLVYSRIITGLGTAAAAAHTISLRALEISQVPGFALGTAGTAMVGQFMGARLPQLAEQAGRMSRNWAVLTMVTLGAVVALFAPWIVRVFVDDPEVVDIGSNCLRVFALAFPLMGVGTALSGALRGAGDVRYVLAVLTVTAWTVRIPAAFLFAVVLGLGAPGAWLGAVAEQNARGMLIWRRFNAGAWKLKEV